MNALRFCFFVSLTSALSTCPLLAEVAAPNDQALFLAGMPVVGSPLERLADEASAKSHAASFESAWMTLETNQLSKIRDWAPANLAPTLNSTGPLFYMFSGPDFLYAHTYFPRASTYVFCGIEPVGNLPDVAQLNESQRSSAMTNLRNSINEVLSFSFFITSKMKTDLKQTQLTGTVPVLYVFLARLGCHIDSAELVGLDDTGQFVSEKAVHPGVKIVFTQAGSAPQTLYYFSSDLSSWSIKQHPGFLRFCDSLGRGASLLKAASYLMHMKEFDAVRDFLLIHSKVLLQDDSGIPLEYFTDDLWDLHHFGNYAGPIDRFKERFQPGLDHAYRALPPHENLPFSYGYRWKANESSMMMALETNTVPKAIPLTEEQAQRVLQAMPR